MKDDILESVSQSGSGEETAENRRIHEIADELHRRCQLYEAQLRTSQDDVNRLDVEQRVAEQYAKSAGIWIPMDDIFDLGIPGPSGNENDTYVAKSLTRLIGFMALQAMTAEPLCPYIAMNKNTATWRHGDKKESTCPYD